MKKGFRQMRVRLHGTLARIEVPVEAFEGIMQEETRAEIITAFTDYGFSYVTFDLQGYRTGSMNQTIEDKKYEAKHGTVFKDSSPCGDRGC